MSSINSDIFKYLIKNSSHEQETEILLGDSADRFINHSATWALLYCKEGNDEQNIFGDIIICLATNPETSAMSRPSQGVLTTAIFQQSDKFGAGCDPIAKMADEKIRHFHSGQNDRFAHSHRPISRLLPPKTSCIYKKIY